MGASAPIPRKERKGLLQEKLFSIVLEGGDRLKPKCFLDEGCLKELWSSNLWESMLALSL